MASNRVAANLVMPAIVAEGLVSLNGIAFEAWPTLPFNTIEVSRSYPGAMPEEVEESIGVKIEEQVSSLDDAIPRLGAALGDVDLTPAAPSLKDRLNQVAQQAPDGVVPIQQAQQ